MLDLIPNCLSRDRTLLMGRIPRPRFTTPVAPGLLWSASILLLSRGARSFPGAIDGRGWS